MELKKILRPLLVGTLLAAVVFAAYMRGLLDVVEFKSLDFRFQVRGPIPRHLPIVVVSIDQDSFDELDLPWPWPRTIHAGLIRKLSQARARLIAFDILFTEPKPDAREDRALAEAIKEAGNVILAAEHTEVASDFGPRIRLSLPIPLIREHARGYGLVNLVTDRDGIIRSGRLMLAFQEKIFPGFAYQTYRAATGKQNAPDERISAEPYLINFRGPARTFPVVPYYRVLRNEIDPEFFRDKIVLVGALSPSLHDVFPTPFSSREYTAGVEIQANFVDTLAANDPVLLIPGWALAGLFCLLSAITIWSAIHFKPLRATATLIACLLLYGFATLFLFSERRLWIPLIPPMAAAMFAYGGIILDHYIREQKARIRMRGMLNKYLSPDIVEEMLKLPAGLGLEGKRRHITVLFSDVRGFTAMSEQISPEQVVSLLSDYLGRAAQIVVHNEGVIDKFIGDAVFAFFGWPKSYDNDALRAVKTGIEMIELVESLAPAWTEIIGRPLKVGVGINTGDAVVGNIGSEMKSDLTAIGDTVNLGARLEALTKELGVPMLISEYTAAELKGAIPLRPLRQVKVQGREAAILVYCPESLLHGEYEQAADTSGPYIQQHK